MFLEPADRDGYQLIPEKSEVGLHGSNGGCSLKLLAVGAQVGVVRTKSDANGIAGRPSQQKAASSDGSTAGFLARFDAITGRRSTRTEFETGPLPSGLREELIVLAREGEVEPALNIESDRKAAIAALIAEGDRVQYANPSFRRELAAWIHKRFQ